MRRIISAIMLVLLLAGTAFALEDSEYRKMKESNGKFAEADRLLNEAYIKLRQAVPATKTREVRAEQREWLDSGRDIAASQYMEEGYPKIKAYTMATNDRTKELTRLYKLYMMRNKK
ncbi:MAG: hypothetical protein IJR85_02465 [Synergistaceae bacterium]|nr:hypothetical protein [Synergistaceae bacterium]